MLGKKKQKRFVYACLAVFFLFSTLVNTGCGEKSKASMEDPHNQAVPVAVTTVAKGSLTRTVNLAAKLSPRMEVNLVPELPGKVNQVNVDLGDSVFAGQALVQLETKDLEAQLRQAEAGLTMAQAKQSIDLLSLDNARVHLERMQELHAQGIVAQSDLEQAQMAFDQASSGIAAAQIEQAEAAVALVRNQLQHLTLSAPISGQIARRQIQPGEMASPGVPVLSIVDLSVLIAEFNVPEGEINALNLGDTLKVKVPAVSETWFNGKVTALAPSADAQTKAFPVKLEIQNAEQQLKPGMFAEIELPIATYADVLILPKDAVVDKGDIKIVYVVSENYTQETKVTTGAADATSIVITEGLEEGDQVIVTGQNTVRDQTLVQVITLPSADESIEN